MPEVRRAIASVSCRAIHSAVGLVVALVQTRRRRARWMIANPQSSLKPMVGQTRGRPRRCRARDCEGRSSSRVTAGRPGMYLANTGTVFALAHRAMPSVHTKCFSFRARLMLPATTSKDIGPRSCPYPRSTTQCSWPLGASPSASCAGSCGRINRATDGRGAVAQAVGADALGQDGPSHRRRCRSAHPCPCGSCIKAVS